MFRELRKPRGDPEVLAAQSREQYFKVLAAVFGSTSSFFLVHYFRVSMVESYWNFNFLAFGILFCS